MISTEHKIKYGGIALVVLLVASGIFYGGFLYGKDQVPAIQEVQGLENKTVGQSEGVDFSLFWEAWRTIEEEYVGRNDLDRQEMVYGAISGMVKALGDPYTAFFPPKEAKVFKEDISGSFEGIGAEIGIQDEVLTVISPLKNSPAERAGLQAGDKIIEVDGEDTEGITIQEAVQQIRGERGTEVVLTIFRSGEDTTQEIAIVRDKIAIPVLEWERIDDNTVHLELFSFSQEAPRRFRQALAEILAKPTDKMVLDLRNNPGGFLEVAQELIGWFVEPGEVVAIEDFGDGRGERKYRAVGNGALRTMDVVVLINGGSASASEIMAGALRDIRGVQLVGEQSFGKGSIQELKNLPKGTSIKVTIARWLTPSGVSISESGLTPDVEVERTAEDVEAEEDPQLERALEILNR